jgi:hypothetical protein
VGSGTGYGLDQTKDTRWCNIILRGVRGRMARLLFYSQEQGKEATRVQSICPSSHLQCVVTGSARQVRNSSDQGWCNFKASVCLQECMPRLSVVMCFCECVNVSQLSRQATVFMLSVQIGAVAILRENAPVSGPANGSVSASLRIRLHPSLLQLAEALPDGHTQCTAAAAAGG